MDFAERAREYAERILRAAGSSLSNYSIQSTRTSILLAALDGYEEAFRAGAEYASEKLRPVAKEPHDAD